MLIADGVDPARPSLHRAISLWHRAELGVAQFDRMDVVDAALGIDNQHAGVVGRLRVDRPRMRGRLTPSRCRGGQSSLGVVVSVSR